MLESTLANDIQMYTNKSVINIYPLAAVYFSGLFFESEAQIVCKTGQFQKDPTRSISSMRCWNRAAVCTQLEGS